MLKRKVRASLCASYSFPTNASSGASQRLFARTSKRTTFHFVRSTPLIRGKYRGRERRGGVRKAFDIPANIGDYATNEIYTRLLIPLLIRKSLTSGANDHRHTDARSFSSYVTFRAAERSDSPRHHLESYLLAIAIFDNFANNRPRINCRRLSNDSSGLDATPPTACNDPARSLAVL